MRFGHAECIFKALKHKYDSVWVITHEAHPGRTPARDDWVVLGLTSAAPRSRTNRRHHPHQHSAATIDSTPFTGRQLNVHDSACQQSSRYRQTPARNTIGPSRRHARRLPDAGITRSANTAHYRAGPRPSTTEISPERTVSRASTGRPIAHISRSRLTVSQFKW